ncbi:MAG TPA: ABC transporter ATP-binding protein, partial [Pseudoxanthomonas sp.]|nr:ABC transporter ATP-binding protein [Pseudoxanthomonas sp.]
IGLVCDTYWRVADGVVEPFDGDLDEYAAWLRTRPAAQGTKNRMAEAAPTPPPKPAGPKKPPNPHKLAQAEKRMTELEEQIAGIDADLADPKVYADPGRVEALGKQRQAAQAALEQAEQAWSALYEEAG